MNLLYALILAVIGLAAVVIELFVPAAGLIGLMGAGCLIASVSLSFIHYGTFTGVIFLVSLLILTPTVIILWFKRFPRSLVGKRLILFNPGEKLGEPHLPEETTSPLTGKKGKSLTDLRPSGTVLMGEEKFSVVTAGEYIPRGTEIEVVQVHGNRIEVRESGKDL